MDTSHLYMFVDYDGVVKTYAENFPDELHDENMPFSMSMIRVLSNIAGLSGLPAYFMPISSSPGRLSKEELLKNINALKDAMRKAAADLRFEEAAQLRDQIIEMKTALLEMES